MQLDSFLHLFLIDLCRGVFHIPYQEYYNKENNYASAWLKAYIAAFNESNNGKISEHLIKKIHKVAMSFNPKNETGIYKINPNFFALQTNYAMIEDKTTFQVGFNTSPEGIKEFLIYWVLGAEELTHLIAIEDLTNNVFFKILTNENNTRSLKIETYKNGKIIDSKEYSLEDTIHFIEQKLIDLQRYVVRIGSMAFNLSTQLEKINREYENERQIAYSEEEKITGIARAIQHIAQLHLFEDGNIRTGYILLNKLLRDNNLSLTLLLNANRLDCCSLREVVAMIKQGQDHFQQFLNNKSDTLPLSFDPLLFPGSDPISFQSQELFDVDPKIISQFIETVLEIKSPLIYHQKLIEELTPFISKSYDSLLPAIKKQDYALAFRKICADGTNAMIEIIINYLDVLAIPLNNPSANGTTALEWLQKNKRLTQEEKKAFTVLLIEKGAEYTVNITEKNAEHAAINSCGRQPSH